MRGVRPRTLPTGFIRRACPPRPHDRPPGVVWLHEIKHDGFRVIARKDGARVRLYSRPGNSLRCRMFPQVANLIFCNFEQCQSASWDKG